MVRLLHPQVLRLRTGHNFIDPRCGKGALNQTLLRSCYHVDHFSAVRAEDEQF